MQQDQVQTNFQWHIRLFFQQPKSELDRASCTLPHFLKKAPQWNNKQNSATRKKYHQLGQILSTKIIKDFRSTETNGKIGQQGMIRFWPLGNKRQMAENNLFVTYLARRDQANQDVCQNQKGGQQKDIFGFKERQNILLPQME